MKNNKDKQNRQKSTKNYSEPSETLNENLPADEVDYSRLTKENAQKNNSADNFNYDYVLNNTSDNYTDNANAQNYINTDNYDDQNIGYDNYENDSNSNEHPDSYNNQVNNENPLYGQQSENGQPNFILKNSDKQNLNYGQPMQDEMYDSHNYSYSQSNHNSANNQNSAPSYTQSDYIEQSHYAENENMINEPIQTESQESETLNPQDFYSKEYKSKAAKTTKKFSFFSVFFAITALLLAFSCANLLSYGLYSSGFSLLNNKQKENAYYFVQVGSFSNYANAQTVATEIMQKSGAGFIYFDGGYRVFTSVYFNMDDAQKVVDKNLQSYPNSTVYILEVQKVKQMKNLTNAQLSAFKNAVTSLINAIKSVYEITIDFDSSTIDASAAKQRLKNVYTIVENAIIEYDNTINSEVSADLYKFRVETTYFLDNLSKMQSSIVSGNEYSALIKYQQIRCIFNLRNAIKYCNGSTI